MSRGVDRGILGVVFRFCQMYAKNVEPWKWLEPISKLGYEVLWDSPA